MNIAHFHHESRNSAREAEMSCQNHQHIPVNVWHLTQPGLVLTNAISAPLTAHCLNAEVILAECAFWTAKNGKFTWMASVECWWPGDALVKQLGKLLFHLSKEHLAGQSKCHRADQWALINEVMSSELSAEALQFNWLHFVQQGSCFGNDNWLLPSCHEPLICHSGSFDLSCQTGVVVHFPFA